MRYLAPLALAFALVACQRADGAANKPAPTEVKDVTQTQVVAASTPAAMPAEEHACGCGMGGGGGCAECGGAGGCDMDMEAADKDQPAAAAAPAGTEWTAMTVDGMHCGGCANRIKKALAHVDGIAAVDVDLTTHTVKIAAAPGADARAIAQPKIDALGYHVE